MTSPPQTKWKRVTALERCLKPAHGKIISSSMIWPMSSERLQELKQMFVGVAANGAS